MTQILYTKEGVIAQISATRKRVLTDTWIPFIYNFLDEV